MNAMIVSNGLDTNGQNTRYVRASERHGTDPAVIKAMALGKTDPAGVVGRYRAAADKLGGLSIRSAHRATPYMQFPEDLVWTHGNTAEIKAMAEAADVIHLNNSDVAMRRLRLRKPSLLHHHGSLFRSNPKYMLDVARHHKMVQAVSTVDLQKPAPDLLHWLPTAYNVDELAAMRQGRDDGRIRLVSAPTNREYKATAQLIAAVTALQGEGLPIDLDLIEGVTWAECMARKAQADILFDQVAFGYGCNAVEAWGMGIPVIAGADDWTLGRMRELWGGLPFYEATTDTIADAIHALATSPRLRKKWADTGHAHVRTYHDELPALTRLAELYAMAIEHYHAPRHATAAEAVRFRSTKGRAVYDPDTGARIPFVDGVHETTDPFVIDRLRYFVKARPTFGIVEVPA